MPKSEANQTAHRAPISSILANATAATEAADVERVAKDLSEAVANGLTASADAAPTPAAPPRRAFTAHSVAASERLLTEERALAETLSDLDAKILELTDQRDDAYRAYAAVQGARQALGGVN